MFWLILIDYLSCNLNELTLLLLLKFYKLLFLLSFLFVDNKLLELPVLLFIVKFLLLSSLNPVTVN